ncbi:MAG: helix-turn-helix domain-containing protein [Polyangiales bacterium]
MSQLRERLVSIAMAYAAKVLDVAAQASAKELAQGIALPKPFRESGGSIEALAERLLDLPLSGSRYREMERALIRRALQRTGNNVVAAARLLGIPRKVLVRRRDRLGA